MDFVEELKWRGLLFDSIPGTQEHLNSGMRSGYVGFDPSAPSLHIGNLVQIMLLVHFQRAGHKPIALVGGATGMIGDPSGKSEERNLLSEEKIRDYEIKVKNQLSKFLDFGNEKTSASLENNYDWFREIKFLDFLRNVGKHLTINYMMAKDSVKSRLETGISYTEFTYQLLQGYDFYWLNQNKGCSMQMGGSDQWGNITAGVELTRRKNGNEVFAVTSPLITRADGKKMGKTETGTVWLDGAMTSPYKFYQYWLNVADEDAAKYLRIFSLMGNEEINSLIHEHQQAAHLRTLQQALAKDITVRVHSIDEYNHAVKASEIIFGKAASEELQSLSDRDFLEIFEGVPTKKISKSTFENGIDMLRLFVDETNFLSSKSEARKLFQSNAISINKQTISLEHIADSTQLINNRYLLLQKGKKNYFLVIAE